MTQISNSTTLRLLLLLFTSTLQVKAQDCAMIQTGEIVITEVFHSPTTIDNSSGQWIELYNQSEKILNLEGVSIESGPNSHLITSSLEMMPGEFIVISNNADFKTNGNVAVDYQYADILISTTGEIKLRCSSSLILIDSIGWNPVDYPIAAGKSLSLSSCKTDFVNNNEPDFWHNGIQTFGIGDFGTPGLENESLQPALQPLITSIDNSGTVDLTLLKFVDSNDLNNSITPIVSYHTTIESQSSNDNTVPNPEQVSIGLYYLRLEVVGCVDLTSIKVIDDQIAPIAKCKDTTIYLDNKGYSSLKPSMIDDGSYDNYGIATFSLSDSIFDCNSNTTQVVTLTVTDSVGNFDMCSATITILDTIPPTAICVDTLYLSQLDNNFFGIAEVNLASFDNCSGLSGPNLFFSCWPQNERLISYPISDLSGNQSTCDIVLLNNRIKLDSIEILAPKDCAFSNGLVNIYAKAPSTIEYSINLGTTWQTSSTFTDLDSGEYILALREIGTSCPSFEFIEITCIPYMGEQIHPSLISGPHAVCDGSIETYEIHLDPNISLIDWYYNGNGTSTHLPSLHGHHKLQIDFTNDIGMHLLLVDFTDGFEIYRDTMTITVLSDTQCSIYQCQPMVIIDTDDMSNNLVPSSVQMQESIITNGVVESDDEYYFSAGNQIELSPGFSIQEGGVFTAEIKDCEIQYQSLSKTDSNPPPKVSPIN